MSNDPKTMKNALIRAMRDIHRIYQQNAYEHIEDVTMHPALYEMVELEFARDVIGYVRPVLDTSTGDRTFTLCGTTVYKASSKEMKMLRTERDVLVDVRDPTKRGNVERKRHTVELVIDVTIKFERYTPPAPLRDLFPKVSTSRNMINYFDPTTPGGPTQADMVKVHQVMSKGPDNLTHRDMQIIEDMARQQRRMRY